MKEQFWIPVQAVVLEEGSEDDYDERCVVVWQDAENPSDFGAEATTLWNIKQGDFHCERYAYAYFRSVMDAPTFE